MERPQNIFRNFHYCTSRQLILKVLLWYVHFAVILHLKYTFPYSFIIFSSIQLYHLLYSFSRRLNIFFVMLLKNRLLNKSLKNVYLHLNPGLNRRIYSTRVRYHSSDTHPSTKVSNPGPYAPMARRRTTVLDEDNSAVALRSI